MYLYNTYKHKYKYPLFTVQEEVENLGGAGGGGTLFSSEGMYIYIHIYVCPRVY